VWMLYAYAAVYGIGFSGTFAMIQVVVAEFFAGASYGRILGVFTMVDTLAGAMGTKALGAMRVAGGSYLPAFDLLIGLCVLVLLALGGLRFGAARRPAAAT